MEEFEASTSRKKTKTIYISTVFGIALVLLMIGLLGLILVEANNLSRYVKENIVLNIYVDDVAHDRPPRTPCQPSDPCSTPVPRCPVGANGTARPATR